MSNVLRLTTALTVILFCSFFFGVQFARAQGTIHFTITDTSGSPIEGAKIAIYDSKWKWRVDTLRVGSVVYSDANGEAEVTSLEAKNYWFNVSKNYMTNRFTIKNVGGVISTSQVTNISVPIRDLSTNEGYLCGTCDNKTWITDSLIVFGVTQMYEADSKLRADGTWYDSNDNHGYWWYNADESLLTYDYDSSSTNAGGSQVEASNITLDDTYFVGDMEMGGMPVTYYMSVVYDTIDLVVYVPDTTLYLDQGGNATIDPNDVAIGGGNYFAMDRTLSKSSFSTADLGANTVTMTLTDRCGNVATVSFTITVESASVGMNDLYEKMLNVYPNPSSDRLFVSFDEVMNSLTLYDLQGKQVLKGQNNVKQFYFDLSGIEKGVYLLEVKTDGRTMVDRVVVQ